jgi:phage/plasmid primase-like uncharacterized protein
MGDVISFDLNLAETNAPRPMSYAQAEERFMAAAVEVGLDLRDIHFGVTQDIVRVHTVDDKTGKRSGWYVIHEEQGLLYGALGNWKGDGYVRFTGRDERTIDADLMRRIELKQEARRREAAEIKRRNAAEAAEIVRFLPAATAEHPYLARKQIKPHGVQLMGSNLLIPIYDLNGEVISTQEISPDGDKQFRAGCSSKGVFVIGGPTPNVVLCEGFATGASIHEATGLRVYVTFNAGNLAALAGEIAAREGEMGGARLVIAADNDASGVGYRKAEEAASAAGGAPIVMPAEVGADWNDVAILRPRELTQAFATVKPAFLSWEEVDPAELPRREWLYGHDYIRKFCSLTVAPGGLGKSTLVLVEAVAMATGRALLGVPPRARLKVVYFNAEDPLDEIKARVVAICQHYGIPQSELVGRLFVQSGRDQDILLAHGPDGDLVEPAFQMITGFARYYGIDVVILDPLANMHDCEETNEVYRRLGKRLSRAADAENCSIKIVHHTRKLNGFAATVEDSRGGSALIGAVRVARVLNPMTAEEAGKLGVESYMDFFRIEPAGKNNLARPAEKAQWFERQGVQIGNGDWVAIVKPWQPPDPFEGIGKADGRAVRARIAGMDPPPRESAQSPDWAGVVVAEVLGIDLTATAGKKRAKQILQQWIATDVLRVERQPDRRQGREISVVVAGDNGLYD